MNNYPEVSIIIPNYNGAKYIEDAISSLLEQTYSNIEIIIVDDYSSDNSIDIVNKIIDEYREYNIILHRNFENKGPSMARNIGIEMSSGDFIAFLDVDDKYVINKIETQMTYLLENQDVDIVYTDLLLIDESGKQTGIMSSVITNENEIEFLIKMLDRQVVPGPASMLMKKSCLNEIRYDENMVHAEDYKFTLELAQQFKFARIKQPLYLCRRHSNNLTNDHAKQVQAEKEVVKSIGLFKVHSILKNSDFSLEKQKIYYFRILLKIDEMDKIVTFINTNKEILCNNLEFNFYAGIANYKRREYLVAKHFFEKALQIKELPEIYNNLGCIYRIMMEESSAMKMFCKALEMKPGYLDAENNLLNMQSTKITTNFLRENLLPYK